MSGEKNLCTLEGLRSTMTQTLPRPTRPRPRKDKTKPAVSVPAVPSDGRPPLMTPGLIAMLGSAMAGSNHDAYNEVYDGIVLGDQSLAFDQEQLIELGITHVLNTAMGKKFNQINTSEDTYEGIGVTFKGISAMDVAGFKINQYFTPAADFIHEALSSGGKVFVHCQMGLSRSATLVLAYLMIKQGMDAQKAMQTIRRERAIMPNDGFLKQLVQLNEEIHGAEQDTCEGNAY